MSARRSQSRLICLIALLLCVGAPGCNFLDPNVRELARFGGTTSPNYYRYISFAGKEINDDTLVEAFPYLDRLRVRSLQLMEVDVSDRSVSLLAVLSNLESLELVETGITAAGMERLRLSKSLKELTIDEGLLSPEELSKLREQLDGKTIIESALWKYRSSDDQSIP